MKNWIGCWGWNCSWFFGADWGPGIGKSTLLLQVSNRLAQQYRILYVCGEESGQQVKLRASRLGVVDAPDKNPLLALSTGAMEPARLPNQLLRKCWC